jgi:uncharacterized protein
MFKHAALLGTLALALAAAPALAQTKKELVAKVLQLQQPGIEAMATGMAQQPAMQIVQQVAPMLQRLPQERREAVSRDIDADLRKYTDEAVPLVRERARALAPSTIGALLEERFTEDELRQVIAILESPVNRKFQQMAPEMQKAISDKLVADTRAQVEPKARAMLEAVNRRVQALNAAPGAPGAPAAPATAGSGPRR